MDKQLRLLKTQNLKDYLDKQGIWELNNNDLNQYIGGLL